MSQFLYFFPGPPGQVPDRDRVRSTFATTALRDLLRSDKTWNGSFLHNPCVQTGPGGLQGTVIAVKAAYPEGFAPAFVQNAQKWVKIDEAWLGWFPDLPPTEASLRKPSMIQGYPVRLNDDCDWMAPTIRCFPQGSRLTLPQAIQLGADGQRQIGVKEFYQHWQDLTEKLWDYRFGKGEMSTGDLVDAAAELLSLNYRVGPKELDALGLFDVVPAGSEAESNWSEVIAASCDWPLVDEFLQQEEVKKKALALSEPSRGQEGEASEDAA